MYELHSHIDNSNVLCFWFDNMFTFNKSHKLFGNYIIMNLAIVLNMCAV